MISSPYVVLSQACDDGNTKPLSGGGRDPQFWTKTLARLGLESPGYKETVDKMKAAGLIKNKKANLNK